MPRKKTHDEFVGEVKSLHPDMSILSEYTGAMNKVLVRHDKCGYEWYTKPTQLVNYMRGCPKCNHATKKSHEEFVDEVSKINPNVEILSNYNGIKNKIKIRYKNCGHYNDILPQGVLRNQSCPFCTGNNVLKGFNDIATTAPHLVKYLCNKDDAFLYTKNSHAKVDCQCPNCGTKIQKTIQLLYKNGLCCNVCSDGVSYPNKYARIFFSQLDLDLYISEYSPEWANSKRYDNYFEYKNKKYIVEMDGGFHFRNTGLTTTEEVKAIDSEKDKMAIDHNINMIRIDCQKSDSEYIKENICKSDLNSIFDLSKN